MIPQFVYRRNRFRKRAKAVRPAWQRLRAAVDWRAVGRRSALLAVVVACLGALAWALNRPVEVVSMDGTFQRVSPVDIEKVITPFLASGFMSADLDGIQHAVETLPWVDQVRVQRRWPISLHLTVIEQTPAALWNDEGLLNTRGELFVKAAAHVPPELPRLSGPTGTEAQVAALYLATEPRMLEAGMRIAALRLDERGAWEMDLSNGITVRLGRDDVQERLDRFIATASQIVAHQLNEISYVDMRYSNGFAIGWRTAAAPAPVLAKRRDDTNA